MPEIIEPDLLQTFLAIAETGRFTEAAKRVHRTQSAVSMQIKRLEEMIGRPLFLRAGRSVQLTADGELLLGHARRILRAHSEALAAFSSSELRGTVTIGAPDEYAVVFLPGILKSFSETHPQVHVNVVCDTSVNLLKRLAENEIDLTLVTHGYKDEGGTIVKRGPVVWASSAGHCVHEQTPVPLALFHPGCRIRQAAIEALARKGRDYRIAYTSVSLSGIQVALQAGLAVGAMPRGNVTKGLRVLDERDGFAKLPDYEIALHRAPDATSEIHDRLEEHILENFRRAEHQEVAA